MRTFALLRQHFGLQNIAPKQWINIADNETLIINEKELYSDTQNKAMI